MKMRSYSCSFENTKQKQKIEKIIKLLKILGDDSRIKILCMLREKELCVCELEEILKLSQSLISHHLKDLREFNLVENEKRGLRVYYQLSKKGKEITDILFTLY